MTSDLNAILSRNDGLEAIKDELSFISEKFGSRYRRNVHYFPSALKDYICGKCGIIVRGLPGSLRDYNLFLYRIPKATYFGAGNVVENNVANAETIDFGGCGNTDSVFIVRDFGHFPDQIISAGKAWSSRIWLLPKNLIPNDVRNFRFQLSLPRVDDFLQSKEGVGPRVIPLKAISAECQGSSIERHIKGMFDVQNSVSQIPLSADGDFSMEYDFSNFFASFRIILDHKSKRVALQIAKDFCFSGLNASSCPIDLILNLLKPGQNA